MMAQDRGVGSRSGAEGVVASHGLSENPAQRDVTSQGRSPGANSGLEIFAIFLTRGLTLSRGVGIIARFLKSLGGSNDGCKKSRH